eukprot:TRINITY_DN9068_c0_g1_i1.p2 TRINITY_DN9068_c0_g1~~TRINITY_DN9068_c0_g1_i1.p2  ORF type:complete len:247 (-),score=61.45 TRINITY_DN9068_c0_g1_i1:70-810(-)
MVLALPASVLLQRGGGGCRMLRAGVFATARLGCGVTSSARLGARCAQLSTRSQDASRSGAVQRFWSWTTQPRPSWRESKSEAAVVFVVFGLTGSTSVALVRPVFTSVTGIEGSMKEGPWSYRIGSLLLVSPVYALVLITFGTLSGRHLFFANMGKKILGRFVPRSWSSHLQCAPAAAKATSAGAAATGARSAAAGAAAGAAASTGAAADAAAGAAAGAGAGAAPASACAAGAAAAAASHSSEASVK